jgi:hypothetical protein
VRWLGVIVIVAAAWAPGCGGKKATAVDPAAPVGAVTAVSGEVRWTSAAQAAPQVVAVGLAVTRDMVLRTDEGASVTVRFHNNYEWTLAGGREKKIAGLRVVDLPKVAEVTSLADELEGEGGDRTTAAGRHAEGSAADSAGTVARAPETAEAPGSTDTRPADEAAPKSDESIGLGLLGTTGDGRGYGTGAAGIGGGAKGGGTKSGGGSLAPHGGAAGGGVQGQIDRDSIRAGMQKLAPRVRKCAETHGATGVIKMKITISPRGVVSAATALDPFAGTPMGTCVEEALAGQAAFTRFSGSPLIVTYPFKLP